MKVTASHVHYDDFGNDVGVVYEFDDGHRWTCRLGRSYVLHPYLIKWEARKHLKYHMKTWRKVTND